MELLIKYILTLTEKEAIALKKVLGRQSDVAYRECGLKLHETEYMHMLYDKLPDEPEEE